MLTDRQESKGIDKKSIKKCRKCSVMNESRAKNQFVLIER